MEYGDLYNHGRWGIKDGWWKPLPIEFEDLPTKKMVNHQGLNHEKW